MKLIEIAALPNGAHNNQTIDGNGGKNFVVPDGWAIIPDDMAIPETFPFVKVSHRRGKVTKLTAGEMPMAEEYEPSIYEQIMALKKQLAAGDYKIIKCAEAKLLGEDAPYDIAELHQQREAIRAEINALELKESEDIDNANID